MADVEAEVFDLRLDKILNGVAHGLDVLEEAYDGWAEVVLDQIPIVDILGCFLLIGLRNVEVAILVAQVLLEEFKYLVSPVVVMVALTLGEDGVGIVIEK